MSALLAEVEAYADVLAEVQRLDQAVGIGATDAVPRDTRAWAERHRRIDGRPFSLDRFRPLDALYRDDHPHVVVMKPAQRGVSEWAINRAIFALEHGAQAWGTDKDGLNVGYLFPTLTALYEFSKERLSGLKSESAHLRGLFGTGEFDGVTFKQVGRSYLYLRGAESESSLLSFAADVLILDEFDRMARRAVALARRRLNASVVRREINLSTPTIPGRGIHALYQQSDQMRYHQPCPECGEWHVYDFFRDVRALPGDGGLPEPHDTWRLWSAERLRRAELRVHCPACGYALSGEERCAPGEWAPLYPEVTGLRGYQIPPLAFPVADLAAMAIASTSHDPSELMEFYRSDLGLPYEGGGSRIAETMLRQLSHDLPGGVLPDLAWRDTTMGVDVGSRFHFRVSAVAPGDDTPYVRAMGAVGSWGDLDELMATYRVRHCVIDALPELHACREWAARHAGKVLRAFYPADGALPGTLCRANDKEGTVQINRTMAMDGVYAAVAGADERWPAAIHNDPEVAAGLTAPVRTTGTDERGQERVSWEHTAPDHPFHACVYDRVARATLPKHEGAPPLPRGARVQGATKGWGVRR